MPRLFHGEILDLDPDIERTFRRRRRTQRNLTPILETVNMENVVHGPHERPLAPNIINIANSRDGRIMDYAMPMLDQLHTGIVRPQLECAHFELKPVMFNMLQARGQFSGSPSEDPHLHLKTFMEISDSFELNGVNTDALRLKLFPFSLRDRARSWYDSLEPNSVETWKDMAEKFLNKYFPPTRNAKSRHEISMFKQMEDEAVPDAWERFKELLRKCPHHGIPYCIQLETFYNGLNLTSKQMLDATAGGAFTLSTYNDGYAILEKISNNNGHWSDSRALVPRKAAGVLEVDTYTALTAQLASLTNMIKNMSSGAATVAAASTQESLPVQCVLCSGGHTYDQCDQNTESVNYVQNRNNQYSNNYNSNWKNHPNFSWNSPCLNPTSTKEQRSTNFQNQPSSSQSQPFYQGKPNQPPVIQSGNSPVSLEAVLSNFINHTNAAMNNQNIALKALETQIGQIAAEMRHRPAGTLPSDTETPKNPLKE